MAAIDRNPISTNFANPFQFQLSLKRAPSLSYQCTRVKLPDVSMIPAKVGSPSLEVAYVGDHIEYSPIQLGFMVDENFQNWQEILNWMNGLTDPTYDGIVYTQLENAGKTDPYQIYSDISVMQYDSQNNPIIDWVFERCFPIGLGGPTFVSQAPNVKYLEAATIIKYTTFKIKRMVLPNEVSALTL